MAAESKAKEQTTALSEECMQRWQAFMELDIHTRLLRVHWLLNNRQQSLLVCILAQHHLDVGGLGEQHAVSFPRNKIEERFSPILKNATYTYNPAFDGLIEIYGLFKRARYQRGKAKNRYYLNWPELDRLLQRINWEVVQPHMHVGWLHRSRWMHVLILQAIAHGDEIKQISGPEIKKRWKDVQPIHSGMSATNNLQYLKKQGLIELGPHGHVHLRAIHSFKATPLVAQLIAQFYSTDFQTLISGLLKKR